MMINERERKHLRTLDLCGVPYDTGPFEFIPPTRYYWTVRGPVPVDVAWQIYRDPAADLIRVSGHCGCPAPEDPWVTWTMPDGTTLASLESRDEFERLEHILGSTYLTQYTFSDDPDVCSKAKGTIDVYHIDSELGLRVFVDYLKMNGLLR